MGTPPFAATILEQLLQWSWAKVCGVYCQPDRPSGRGHALHACAVKQCALTHGLPVWQPQNFKSPEACAALEALQPDFLIVAAYGLLLPQKVLDIARVAPVNVHGSILPLYRGAAPIQRAVWDNCATTGVSIMRMEAGLDTGPVYAVRTLPIGEHTAGSLHEALSVLGAQALEESLPAMARGDLRAVAQDNTRASHAAKLTKGDGRIDWDVPCVQVHAQVRAVLPWPAAQTVFLLPEREALDIQFTVGAIVAQRPDSVPSGALWHFGGGKWGIVTRDGVYAFRELKVSGKKMVSALAFAQGYFPKGVTGAWGRALSPAEMSPRV
ncbi:MAG: methionyl-tRNA formyltransferase [Desulfovibrionaceae bacterium]